MAVSKCGACGKTGFEIAVNSPNGASYKVLLIQCASCGTVISSQDYFNVGATGDAVTKAIQESERRIMAKLDYLMSVLSQRG